jgi:Zn finger protein HypA/HybF involved in hydrogenase expression
MPCICKGICDRYKGKRRYFDPPNKKCRSCDLFIDAKKWDGVLCPCCHGKLSTIPNHTSDRQKLLIKRKVKRIG